MLVIHKQRSGARKLFLIYRSRIFLLRRRASESWEVRHDLDYVPCDEWRQKPGHEGHRWNVPRVLILHMQNRFLLLISHDATAPGRGNLEAYVRLSTVPGDFFLWSTMNGFLCVFSKKPFQMDYCMSLSSSQRWIYLSLCLLLQWRWPLNVQCNSILSISSPRMGVTFCLCFATHEYMLTLTRVRICVFMNIHVCKNMCMLTFI